MPDQDLRDHIGLWKSASPNQWGMLTLSRDPLNRLFSEAQKAEIVAAAIECGRSQAEALLQKRVGPVEQKGVGPVEQKGVGPVEQKGVGPVEQKGVGPVEQKGVGPVDPLQLAARMGIKISSHDYPIGENKHILFAQYEKHEITYAKGIIEKINQLMESEGLKPMLDRFDPVAAILTHELYHCLEDEQPGILTRTMKIPFKVWKVFTQRATPIMAGEIAAFSFSQTLCQLDYHPRIVELLGIWCFNRDLAKALTASLLAYPA